MTGKFISACCFLLVFCFLLSSCGEAGRGPEETEAAVTSETESPPETDAPLPEKKYSETEVSVEYRNDPEEFGIDAGAAKVITDYFNIYFSSLGRLRSADISTLFSFDTDYERRLCQTMIDYQIRIRDGMDIDLSYGKCSVGLTFRNAETAQGRTVVDLYENDYMDFAFAGDVTSYTSGVEHTFTLERAGESWLIVSHSEISGVYDLLTSKFAAICEDKKLTLSHLTANQISEVFSALSENLVKETSDALEKLYEQKSKVNSGVGGDPVLPECDEPYDAEAAVAYSYEWAGKYDMLRNPAYAEYDNYGGNCNNYTSQCIFAGGIPMDFRGDIYNQWKYYGPQISGYNRAYGRSMSWTGVEDFWNYCTTNEGFGMVTLLGDDPYLARPGDIVQYTSDGVGVHSVIVSKVIYDGEGGLAELMINSNTTDKVDCPMSIYGYTGFRLIRIIGWNK